MTARLVVPLVGSLLCVVAMLIAREDKSRWAGANLPRHSYEVTRLDAANKRIRPDHLVHAAVFGVADRPEIEPCVTIAIGSTSAPSFTRHILPASELADLGRVFELPGAAEFARVRFEAPRRVRIERVKPTADLAAPSDVVLALTPSSVALKSETSATLTDPEVHVIVAAYGTADTDIADCLTVTMIRRSEGLPAGKSSFHRRVCPLSSLGLNGIELDIFDTGRSARIVVSEVGEPTLLIE